MSAQIVELLVFAAIAFFIITKLISIVGTTDEKDFAKKRSKFGEPTGLKDVTSSGTDWTSLVKITKDEKIITQVDKNLLLDPDNQELIENLGDLEFKIEKFSTKTFVKNASKAWKMVIVAIDKNDHKTIETLVDKRYIDELFSRKESYANLDINSDPELKIADLVFFGNSVMIKIIIQASGIDSEEWTFMRNQHQSGPNWYLSNIERAA